MGGARSIYIGFDPREAAAFAVARHSIEKRLSSPVPIYGLVLDDLRAQGLYTRPTEKRKSAADGEITWDLISDAPVATEFSNSRWLVLELARRAGEANGWCLFLDCDMLVRANLCELFRYAETQNDKAVLCVKHRYEPTSDTKMDSQIQTKYARKNWSSLMMLNGASLANDALTPEMVNTIPGRDLHRFAWLDDDEIGELGPEWNFLVRHNDPAAITPRVIHFTEGLPLLPGYANDPFADEWRRELYDWAS